ncbi:MAG: DUF1365 domain-containing protein [Acidimicrobiales bacterium]
MRSFRNRDLAGGDGKQQLVPSSQERRSLPALPCLYQVDIGHSRRAPVRNDFRYRSYMWLFDVDEPPVMSKPWRPLARYRPADHLDVRRLMADQDINVSKLVVLTNLAVAGYVFNPISIYWGYREDGTLLARAAEVHNTYGSRHCYVLRVDDPEEKVAEANKEMYVSPFYPVDGKYRISISDPGPSLAVSVTLERPQDPPFRAWMSGKHVPESPGTLLRLAVRYPAAPLRGRALIQWQGLRLWSRGVPIRKQAEVTAGTAQPSGCINGVRSSEEKEIFK